MFLDNKHHEQVCVFALLNVHIIIIWIVKGNTDSDYASLQLHTSWIYFLIFIKYFQK